MVDVIYLLIWGLSTDTSEWSNCCELTPVTAYNGSLGVFPNRSSFRCPSLQINCPENVWLQHGSCGARQDYQSLLCACVYYPDLYSQWTLRSVASSHTANYPIPDKQQVNQRSPPCPKAQDTYSSNTGQSTPLQVRLSNPYWFNKDKLEALPFTVIATDTIDCFCWLVT